MVFFTTWAWHGILQWPCWLDLVQEMFKTKHPPKKDEVIIARLKMARRPSKHLLKKATGSSQQRQTMELHPAVLDVPRRGTGIQVDIRGGSKDGGGLDWGARRGKGRPTRQLERFKDNCGDRWSKAASLRVREGDWAVHIFREHNEEGDAWAEQGACGIEREPGVWPDVTGICGFWDGSRCTTCTGLENMCARVGCEFFEC